MKLQLHISTCPNDTFMFDAMVHHRIDTEGLEFDLSLADIEQLNAGALQGVPDISKLSYAVVPQLLDRYRVLHSGSALGRGNGPLLVSRHRIYPDEVSGIRVAIPGEHTTANRLLATLYPGVTDKRVYLFSDVADAVMSDECDAGVLIHEGRFTYREKGLRLVAISARSGRKRPDCRCRSARSPYRGGLTGRRSGRSTGCCGAASNSRSPSRRLRRNSCAGMRRNSARR